MNLRKLFLVGAIAAGFALMTATSAVHAEPEVTTTYNVNSIVDEQDANLDKPACRSATGKCTLRAAIMQGNKTGGTIVINVPLGIYILLNGGRNEDQAKTGDLDVYGNMTIQGVGGSPIIDGGLLDRVFDLQKGSKVQLKNLVIQNGFVRYLKVPEIDSFGGGIRSRAINATLTNVQVLHNFANAGGGIANLGLLNIYNSTISNNHGEGGGIYNRKWNDYFAGELHMFNSTVSRNDAGFPLADGSTYPGAGGAIQNYNAKLYVSNSTLYKNHAGWGGGVANVYGGRAYLVNVTVSSNVADDKGGGIYNYYPSQPPPLPVTKLSNVTVVGNRAQQGGGIFNGKYNVTAVRNSIIAKNRRYITSNYFLADDCAGKFDSDGSNLIGSNLGCTGFTNGSQGDQVGTLLVPIDPKLGSLASNGGPTKTYALLPGSKAIDRGNLGGCNDSNAIPITTDQRGYARQVDGDQNGSKRCDIGAFEYAP
jgi:CSLREA domain-containing protein